MGSYHVYRGPSNYSVSASHARGRKTPLEKAARWVADKAVNTALDTVLSRILAGPLLVRILGAVTTGLFTAFITWIAVDKFLPQLMSHPVAAIPIAVGALAGAAMGGSRGLLIGAGFGWLVAILAESSASELTKEHAEKHLNFFLVWCASTVVGGLAGWVAEFLFDKLATRFRILGRLLQVFIYLIIIVSVAATFLVVASPHLFWRIVHEWIQPRLHF